MIFSKYNFILVNRVSKTLEAPIDITYDITFKDTEEIPHLQHLCFTLRCEEKAFL